MEVAILLNRKLGGYYFARLGIFPCFPRKVEMRLEQNYMLLGNLFYARKVCFRRAPDLRSDVIEW